MAQKKLVIIKHVADNGKYLFKVPECVDLKAGSKVVCDTCRGTDQLGVCLCDSFTADAEVICPLFGTQVKNLRYVTGIVEYDRFSISDEEEEEEAE